MEIERLHLLIHPGFCLDSEDVLRVLPDKQQKGFRELFEKYIKRASCLESDEAMVAFIDVSVEEMLKRRVPAETLERFTRLNQAIQPRGIMATNKVKVFSPDGQAFDFVRSRLANKGMVINRDTETVAIGETLPVCVADAANAFNIAGGFTRKTRILPELTDQVVVPGLRSLTPKYIEDVLLKDRPRIELCWQGIE